VRCPARTLEHPLKSALTFEDLRRSVREHFADFNENDVDELSELARDPRRRDDLLRMTLGVEVALNLLGSVRGGPTTLRALSGSEFFGALDGVVPQFRLERFGEVLFNLQATPGFKDWIADFPAVSSSELSKMLAGRYAEVDAAGLMHGAGVLRGLRARTNRKGHNYDCDLAIDGVAVAAEIKAKTETAVLSPFAIRRAVEKACEAQLPPDTPGIVWLKLPQAWLQSPVIQLNLDMAVFDIRQAQGRRPLAVIFHWKEFDGLIVRTGFDVKCCAADARQIRLAVQLRDALETQPAAEAWVRFVDVVHDSLSRPPFHLDEV